MRACVRVCACVCLCVSLCVQLKLPAHAPALLFSYETKKGRRALHVAAQHGRVEIGAVLVSAGVHVDDKLIKDGMTPLMVAAKYRQIDVSGRAHTRVCVCVCVRACVCACVRVCGCRSSTSRRVPTPTTHTHVHFLPRRCSTSSSPAAPTPRSPTTRARTRCSTARTR